VSHSVMLAFKPSSQPSDNAGKSCMEKNTLLVVLDICYIELKLCYCKLISGEPYTVPPHKYKAIIKQVVWNK
jgi:hypothetical protein